MNIFTFSGHLGRDSELKQLQSGTSVCSFSVPATKGFGDNKKTTWIRCNLWGKRAESLHEYLNQGQQVIVSGELFVSEWEKDGKTNKSVEVDVRELDLIGDRSSRNQDRGVPEPAHDTGEDVPF